MNLGYITKSSKIKGLVHFYHSLLPCDDGSASCCFREASVIACGTQVVPFFAVQQVSRSSLLVHGDRQKTWRRGAFVKTQATTKELYKHRPQIAWEGTCYLVFCWLLNFVATPSSNTTQRIRDQAHQGHPGRQPPATPLATPLSNIRDHAVPHTLSAPFRASRRRNSAITHLYTWSKNPYSQRYLAKKGKSSMRKQRTREVQHKFQLFPCPLNVVFGTENSWHLCIGMYCTSLDYKYMNMIYDSNILYSTSCYLFLLFGSQKRRSVSTQLWFYDLIRSNLPIPWKAVLCSALLEFYFSTSIYRELINQADWIWERRSSPDGSRSAQCLKSSSVRIRLLFTKTIRLGILFWCPILNVMDVAS